MNRWIRARVVIKARHGETKIYTDVGPDELKKLKEKYSKVTIEDWGRYSEPRNEADERDKKLMKEILK